MVPDNVTLLDPNDHVPDGQSPIAPDITEARDVFVHFTTQEEYLFGHLFDLADVDGDGYIDEAREGEIFLRRTGLDVSTRRKICMEACGGSSHPPPRMDRGQWFLACKLVAMQQHTGRCSRRALHDTASNYRWPLPDFALSTPSVDGDLANAGQDGWQPDDRALRVTIYSHQVVSEGYSSHTVYNVLTETALPQFSRSKLEVSRRFRDFEWLHNCFARLGGVMLPQLPGKKWVGNQHTDFLSDRQKWLQHYLHKVAQHPVLRCSYELQVFLEGTPQGLKAAKALLPWDPEGRRLQTPRKKSSSAQNGHACLPSPEGVPQEPSPDSSDRELNSHHHAGGSSRVRRRSWSGGSDKSGGAGSGGLSTPPLGIGVIPPPSTWSAAAGGYVWSVWGSVKNVVGITKPTAPVVIEADEAYEAAISRLEAHEPPLRHAVATVETATQIHRSQAYELQRLGHYLLEVATLDAQEGSSACAHVLKCIGRRMDRVGESLPNHVDGEVHDFLDVLKEHEGYQRTVASIAQQRRDAVAELQEANGSLQRNKQRMQSARAGGSQAGAEAAEHKMRQAQARMEAARCRMDTISSNFKAEVQRYQRERKSDFQCALLDFARLQADYLGQVQTAWTQVLEDLNPTDAEMQASLARIRSPVDPSTDAASGMARAPQGATSHVAREAQSAAALPAPGDHPIEDLTREDRDLDLSLGGFEGDGETSGMWLHRTGGDAKFIDVDYMAADPFL